jgi:hypothetical protein
VEILEAVLWIIFELVGDIVFEALLEMALGGLKGAFDRENRDPAIATVGYAVLGAVIGGLSILCLPHPILRASPIPGVSIVLGPLAAGLAMEWWGRYRTRRGYDPTNLATWYGGAALAFTMSLVRYLGTR